MLSTIHNHLKSYLKDYLVCPFGQASIKKGDTLFAERISIIDVLSQHPVQMVDKLEPYHKYLTQGDGMIIPIMSNKSFDYGNSTKNGIEELKTEVAKAMCDVTVALSYVLLQCNKDQCIEYWKDELLPILSAIPTEGRDIRQVQDTYKKFKTALQVHDVIGTIMNVWFNEKEKYATMMFYMGPEYHDKHPRYMPRSSIVLTKSLAFRSVGELAVHTLAKKIFAVREKYNIKNFNPSSFVNPDPNLAEIEYEAAENLLKVLGIKSRTEFVDDHFIALYRALSQIS